MVPEMVPIIKIFTKSIFLILQKSIRKLFWNFEKFVVQKLEYIPQISGVFLCYLAFSLFIESLKGLLFFLNLGFFIKILEIVRKCFIAPKSVKNRKNQNLSKNGQKIDSKNFVKSFDIFHNEKDEEIVEKIRGKSEMPWTSVHELNPNWQYFGQNFGKTEIQQIEQITGKEWAKKWEARRKIKSNDQKIRDRKLMEEIGCRVAINGESATPNWSQIKKIPFFRLSELLSMDMSRIAVNFLSYNFRSS